MIEMLSVVWEFLLAVAVAIGLNLFWISWRRITKWAHAVRGSQPEFRITSSPWTSVRTTGDSRRRKIAFMDEL